MAAGLQVVPSKLAGIASLRMAAGFRIVPNNPVAVATADGDGCYDGDVVEGLSKQRGWRMRCSGSV